MVETTKRNSYRKSENKNTKNINKENIVKQRQKLYTIAIVHTIWAISKGNGSKQY